MAKKFMSMLVWSVTGLVCSAVVFVLWCDGAARAQQAQIPVAQAEKPNLSGSAWVPASVPRIIAMNGSLRDLDNRPLTGVIGVSFSLYREQQGGAPLWTEIQNVHLDEQGRYTVLLGATRDEGVPMELFSSAESRWLSVQAQLPGQEELPRILLASVPYALHAGDADTIGGKPASAFVLAPPEGQMNSRSAKAEPERSPVKSDSPAMFGLSGTGTLNHIAKWTDSMGTLGDTPIVDDSADPDTAARNITTTFLSDSCGMLTDACGPAFNVVGTGNYLTLLEVKNNLDNNKTQSELALFSARDGNNDQHSMDGHYTAVGSTSHSYTLSQTNHNITGDSSYIIAGPAMTAGLFVHADAGDIHFRVNAQNNLVKNSDICRMNYTVTTAPPPANGSSVPFYCEIDSAQDGTYVIVKNASSGTAAQAIFTAISDRGQGQISMGTTSSAFADPGSVGIPASAGFLYSGADNTNGLYIESRVGPIKFLPGGTTPRATLNSTGAWQWDSSRYANGALLADASGNILSGTLSVSNGGTGATTFTTNRIPYFNGSTFTNSVLSQTNGEIHQVSGTKFYLDQNPSGVSFAGDNTALAGDTNTLYFYHGGTNILKVTDAQSNGTCIWINGSLRRLSLSGSTVVDGGAC